jgi:hypothetical protein
MVSALKFAECPRLDYWYHTQQSTTPSSKGG